jgi:hypothetical protein
LVATGIFVADQREAHGEAGIQHEVPARAGRLSGRQNKK